MTKTLAWIGVLGALVLLSGCSSVTYVSDMDTQTDFSRYETFALYELPTRAGRETPRPAPNAIVAGRIQRSVKGELMHRGLQAKPTAEADLLITYNIALRHGMRVYHGGWGHPYRGCWGPGFYGGWGSGYSSARVVTEGTLIIDVLDRSTRRMVWRGIADGAFKKPNPSDQEVAKVVAGLLQSFPVG